MPQSCGTHVLLTVISGHFSKKRKGVGSATTGIEAAATRVPAVLAAGSFGMGACRRTSPFGDVQAGHRQGRYCAS